MPPTTFARTAVLLGALGLACAGGLARPAGAEPTRPAAQAVHAVDSKAMEKALQQLTWPQFRAVVEAIPKLRADVEAYGEAGWQFVRANYRHYGWKRNIDRLDAAQKRELAGLIEKAKRGH